VSKLTEEKKTSQKGFLASVQTYLEADPSSVDVTTVKGFFHDLILRMRDVDISGLGAQLAYFFLLSFFPLLIFIVALLPFLNLNQKHIFDFLSTVVPTEVFLLTQGTLVEILTNQHNGGLLSISIIGTIWSASRGVNALIKALNETYDTEVRSSLINRAWSLVFTVALVVVILLALVIPIFGHYLSYSLFTYLGEQQSFTTFWTTTQFILPPILIFLVLMLMYWMIPNTDPRLRVTSVIPGSIFATLAWLILIYGFSFYLDYFGNFSSTYGSIAGVIVLMLWLYFTGMILIFGGLLNASMQRRKLEKMEANNNIISNS